MTESLFDNLRQQNICAFTELNIGKRATSEKDVPGKFLSDSSTQKHKAEFQKSLIRKRLYNSPHPQPRHETRSKKLARII